MQGIILVDKPAGWTSFDVVNYVRRRVAEKEGKKPRHIKVGHTGTLDPFATGLLVLLVGKEYTRKAAELSKADKTYEVALKLGYSSSTGDPEGEITAAVSTTAPTSEAVAKALEEFRGPIMQTPPAYSAVKVGGQRAYKLARAGKAVEIEPRPVSINRLDIISYKYPEARLKVNCSSGTYIRTLVENIGVALKTSAYTTELRRTEVGQYSIKDCFNISDITPDFIATYSPPPEVRP